MSLHNYVSSYVSWLACNRSGTTDLDRVCPYLTISLTYIQSLTYSVGKLYAISIKARKGLSAYPEASCPSSPTKDQRYTLEEKGS
jgi:hypothetical protein